MKKYIVRISHEFIVEADNEDQAIDLALERPYSTAYNCDIDSNEIEE